MTGDHIPENDHISRYVSATKKDSKGWPFPAAFQLSQLKQYLSVDWLEFYGNETINQQLEDVRFAITQRKFILQKYGSFAVLNVGYTISQVKSRSKDNRKLEITHQPTSVDGNDPHSGIFNCNHSDLDTLYIASLIAQTTRSMHSARSS